MADLRELYQEVILDHNRRPRNFAPLDGANRTAEGYNPLCGDRLTVYLEVREGVVRRAAFEGAGCAISKASASMMTETVKGKTVEEAERMFRDFQAMVTTPAGEEPPIADLGKLAVFAGVREYPARVKCASLAWHTLNAALKQADAPATTEDEAGE
jgi:nitrogen fixation NifU-like protein